MRLKSVAGELRLAAHNLISVQKYTICLSFSKKFPTSRFNSTFHCWLWPNPSKCPGRSVIMPNANSDDPVAFAARILILAPRRYRILQLHQYSPPTPSKPPDWSLMID